MPARVIRSLKLATTCRRAPPRVPRAGGAAAQTPGVPTSLDRGLGADQQRALLPRVEREQLQRLGERRVRRVEPARAEEGVGPRLQQLHPVRRVSVVREQPQGALQRARCARRRLPDDALGSLGEQVDGGAVAAAGGVLDVMGTLDRSRPAALERVCRAGVRSQSPRARRRGVDGVTDGGWRKTNRRGTDVGRISASSSSVSSAASGSSRRSAISATRSGSTARPRPPRLRARGEPRPGSASSSPANAAATAAGIPAPPGPRSAAKPRRIASRELLEVERVAAAELIELAEPPAAAEPAASASLSGASASRSARAARTASPRAATSASGAWPSRQATASSTRALGRAAGQRRHQVQRGRIRPVQVVETQHERACGREPLQQAAERAVHDVALGRRRRRAQEPLNAGIATASASSSSPASRRSRAASKVCRYGSSASTHRP